MQADTLKRKIISSLSRDWQSRQDVCSYRMSLNTFRKMRVFQERYQRGAKTWLGKEGVPYLHSEKDMKGEFKTLWQKMLLTMQTQRCRWSHNWQHLANLSVRTGFKFVTTKHAFLLLLLNTYCLLEGENVHI